MRLYVQTPGRRPPGQTGSVPDHAGSRGQEAYPMEIPEQGLESAVHRTGGSVRILERLPHFDHARVAIYYNQQSGISDQGRLGYLDDHFLELVKDNGERFLIPLP